ncbi:hypothetical protein EVAR_78037_1 [Eumeta japonica]|uniref:Mariner Mos1 transposase n=1 Tax=Eumeta variegata TaxID=151549 RepID=A0A4C1T2S0_EUMVA|nr:hypothetical protein EVAR_78037_1 [Eumeta japonica]
MTGDEKSLQESAKNHGQKANKLHRLKSGLTRNKLMLCVWWDSKGIIHYQLLPPRKTTSSSLLPTTVETQARGREKTTGIDQQKRGSTVPNNKIESTARNMSSEPQTQRRLRLRSLKYLKLTLRQPDLGSTIQNEYGNIPSS